jgi:hypothetical protein
LFALFLSGGMVETQGPNGLLNYFNNWKMSVRDRLKSADTVQLFSGLSFAHGILGLGNNGHQISRYGLFMNELISMIEVMIMYMLFVLVLVFFFICCC